MLSRWKGLPDSVAQSSICALQRKKHDRERSLDKKKEQLAELLVQHIAFKNLESRNKKTAASRAAAGTGGDPSIEGGCDQDPEEISNSKVCEDVPTVRGVFSQSLVFLLLRCC